MSQDIRPGSAPHTVAAFDADLKVLGGMVAEMGQRAGRALAEATRALTERNLQLAQQVIASDRALDLLQHEIEEKAVTTLARRQPLAVDLREVVSTMRVAPSFLKYPSASAACWRYASLFARGTAATKPSI